MYSILLERYTRIVNVNNPLQQPIHDSITRLNADILDLVLPDDFTAMMQDRSHFIASMERLYQKFLDQGETELKAVKGVCSHRSCGNCGSEGYTYVGPNSGFCIRFIWDEEGDLEQCHEMKKVDERVTGLRDIDFRFKPQDEMFYRNRPDILAIVPEYRKAIEDIMSNDDTMTLDDINEWIDRCDLVYLKLFGLRKLPPIGFPEKARQFYYIFEDLSGLVSDLQHLREELQEAASDPMDTLTDEGRNTYVQKYEDLYQALSTKPDLEKINWKEGYFMSGSRYPKKVSTEGFESLLKFVERFTSSW